jgi:hypothetical protein
MVFVGNSESRSIEFPQQFQGVFSTTRTRFAPLLAEARERLRAVSFPDEMKPHYAFGVLEHSQPSFMLLPLMYLALAEQRGGVSAKHRAYLPWFMLAMEVIAVVDDTLDCARTRSGRQTYVERYGSMGALPFSHFLLATAIEGTAADVPEAVPLLARSFSWLCSLETVEVATRYPSADLGVFDRLLGYHYDQARCQVAHATDAALVLHDLPRFPDGLALKMGELMQDVDDLVNLVEQRELIGENDDLKLGTVTHALVSTLRAKPSLGTVLEKFWAPYRAVSRAERIAFLAGLERSEEESRTAHRTVRDAMLRIGVPATIAKIATDLRTGVADAPAELRAYADEMCGAFADRVAHMGDLPEVGGG